MTNRHPKLQDRLLLTASEPELTATEPERLPGVTAETDRRRRKGDGLIAAATLDSLSPDEIHNLLQDLSVHRIELEMQNEELREVQEALELSRARYFDLYDLAPVGYVTLSEQGLICEANLAAASLLGVSRSALVKRPLTGFMLPDDRDRFYCCRAQLFDSGERQICELHLRQPAGEPFLARLEFALGKRHPSEALDCLVTLSDLRERECAAAARLAAAAHHEENQRKDHFFALLGHELRNPLAPIRHVADSLRLMPNLPAHFAQAVEILSRQVEHLACLIDDLLDVASIGRGKIRIARQPCDLCATVAHAVEMMRAHLEQYRQSLDLSLPDTPVILDGDPMRLTQIVVNLLRNASQFSPPDARVSLTLEVANGYAIVRVRDWGAGIDPSLLTQIFDPFMQAGHCAQSGRANLGLGLALVKGLAELHDGKVEALSSGPNQGTTFTVRLPLSNAN